MQRNQLCLVPMHFRVVREQIVLDHTKHIDLAAFNYYILVIVEGSEANYFYIIYVEFVNLLGL